MNKVQRLAFALARKEWMLLWASLPFLFQGSVAAAQPSGKAELLRFAQQAHKASRELVRTCSCAVEFKIRIARPNSAPSSTQSCSSRFWYSLDGMRAKVCESAGEADYLWKDSVCQVLSFRTTKAQKRVSAVRAPYKTRYQIRCDPSVRALLVFDRPMTLDAFPLEQLLDLATQVKAVTRKSIAGREMIVLDLFFDALKAGEDGWNVEIHLDPAMNYLARKVIYSVPSRAYHREEEVVQVKECSPGLFFPERIIGRSVLEGKETTSSTCKISEIRVNQPLPPEVFTMRYPEGVTMVDNVRGTQYRIDSGGKRVSQETSSSRGPRAIPPPPSDSPGAVGTESQEEPKSLSRWLVPVSLAALVLAAALVFMRKRREHLENNA